MAAARGRRVGTIGAVRIIRDAAASPLLLCVLCSGQSSRCKQSLKQPRTLPASLPPSLRNPLPRPCSLTGQFAGCLATWRVVALDGCCATLQVDVLLPAACTGEYAFHTEVGIISASIGLACIAVASSALRPACTRVASRRRQPRSPRLTPAVPHGNQRLHGTRELCASHSLSRRGC